jgi:hypothetical protein
MSNNFVYNAVTGQLDLVNDSSGGSGAVTSVNGQTGDVVINVNKIVEKITLTSTHISNKYVPLSFTPTSNTSVELSVIGGPDQEYGIDYVALGARLSWSSLSLDAILTTGDVLKITYTY